MGVIHAKIDEELDRKFRIKIIQKYGTAKGSLEKAVEEAIILWIEKEGSSVTQ